MLTENEVFIEDIEYIKSTITKDITSSSFLITGACGMIGTMLSFALIQAGAKVYGVDISSERAKERFSEYINNGSFVFINCDITKPLSFDFDVDYIIHAASNAYPKAFEVDPVGTMLQNFFGTKYLLDYAAEKKARLLYISTGEVYGQYSGEDFNENSYGWIDVLNPRSCYPCSKRAAETLLASYVKQYGADALTVRLSHTYGLTATAADTRASTEFLRCGAAGEDIVMKSKGEQVRSYTYIADCVGAVLFILFNGVCGEAYNVAFESGIISIRDMAQLIADLSGVEVRFELPDEAQAASFNPATRSVLNAGKLSQLGYEAHYDIYEGIKRTLRALKTEI